MKLFKPLSREQKINLIAKFVFIGFIAAVIYHFFINGIILHRGYPYSTFLFRPDSIFSDFTNWFNISKNYNPYLEAPSTSLRNVFPLPYLLGFLIQPLGLDFSKYLFLSFFSLIMFYLCLSNIKGQGKFIDLINTVSIALLSYPFLFALNRANLEIVIFIMSYITIYLFYKKRYMWSAVFLSVAIAFKAIPAIFLVLFLSEKRIKEIAVSLILAGVLTIIPLLTFPGGLIANLNRFMENATDYTNAYVIGHGGLAYGHSLWGVMKIMLFIIFRKLALIDLTVFYNIFQYAVLIILFMTIPYILLIEKLYWKKVTLLAFSLLLFSPVSADYKLLHVFIPLFFFINKNSYDKVDWVYLVLFALLLIPKNYFNTHELNIGIVINPLVMLMMFCLIIIEGFRNNRVMPAFLAKFKK